MKGIFNLYFNFKESKTIEGLKKIHLTHIFNMFPQYKDKNREKYDLKKNTDMLH